MEPQADEEVKSDVPEARAKRRRILLIAAPCSVWVLWMVAKTEKHVANLHAQGFTDVAIDSARNHAYFPIIGAILGAGLFIAISIGIKRCLQSWRN